MPFLLAKALWVPPDERANSKLGSLDIFKLLYQSDKAGILWSRWGWRGEGKMKDAVSFQGWHRVAGRPDGIPLPVIHTRTHTHIRTLAHAHTCARTHSHSGTVFPPGQCPLDQNNPSLAVRHGGLACHPSSGEAEGEGGGKFKITTQ